MHMINFKALHFISMFSTKIMLDLASFLTQIYIISIFNFEKTRKHIEVRKIIFLIYIFPLRGLNGYNLIQKQRRTGTKVMHKGKFIK